MKTIVVVLSLILATATAHADVRLVCKTESQDRVTLQSFYFLGAKQDIRDAKKLLTLNTTYSKSQANKSVSNTDPAQPTVPAAQAVQYEVLSFSANRYDYTLTLSGGGSLKFGLQNDRQFWTVYFVRPNGPEMPQVLKNCEVLIPEVGFTVRN